ncbi:MAG: adenosylcobinamide-phosphate synthase [Methanobacterium sp.]|jgi:adenosylcobinamide-phosphate synthase|uniref:cobalamin biosynthesis protein n=1 Tax=Methanobacterium sp. TaxID=2164 RepID=UPI0003C9993F|nr:cobalamin biosynthesis protein [Methanobacterium sp.]MDI3550771.1 adenosylcobinamide-phosphate synthase [Methanobacterium sp.]CDG66105.1 cobalamin biosynthesis protein CbiB [Methanobacterium sp. MB1]
MVIELLIVIFISVLIDLTVGELPSSIHPVVWMGKGIYKIKTFLIKTNRNKNRLNGFIMAAILIFNFNLIFLIILTLSSINPILYLAVASILLSTNFAIKSLINSVDPVYQNLNKDLEKSRESISLLVSRNTSQLSEKEIVSATIETLTENITDSIVSPLFYIFLFGYLGICGLTWFNIHPATWWPESLFTGYQLPVLLAVLGGVSYRVVNTLDAMVGYKDNNNLNIGWFSARFDDLLNYIPARITGVLVVLSALILGQDYKCAWKIMQSDARNTPSPNSGYPMAAAAGALGVQLIKPGVYTLGYSKNELKLESIKEAINLTKIVTVFFIMLILLLTFIFLVFL